MKSLKIIFIILLILVVALLVIAFFLPTSVHIEKSKQINSSEQIVFQQVNNLHHWELWSPFDDEDTTMKIYYNDIEEGIGAVMIWGAKMDTGNMTIVESIPSSYLKMKLDFITRGTAESEWKFAASDTGTLVTWSLDVMDLGYPMGRFYGLMMPSMMNGMYEKRLSNLKVFCEKLPDIEGLKIENITAQPALIIKDSADMNTIILKMSQMYGELMGYMTAMDIEMNGFPFTIWYRWDVQNQFVFEAGIPIIGDAVGKGRIEVGEIAAGKVITAPNYGNYDKTADVHNAIQKYLEVMNIQYIGQPWEVYITDPSTEPDTNKWLTLVYYRIE